MLLLFVLLPILVPAFADVQQSCEQLFTGNCNYESIGTQLQCIGSKLEQRLLTMHQAERAIQDVLARFPSDSTYHSVGLITGSSVMLAMGHQSHYRFDASLSMRANPYAIGKVITYYVDEVNQGRPVLIFTDDTYPLLDFPKSALSYNVIEGSKRTKVAYQLPADTLEIMRQQNTPCSRFSAWKQLTFLSDYPSIAIVLPTSFYCKETAHTYGYVYYGEYVLEEVSNGDIKQQYLYPKWEVSKESTHGPAPQEIVKDF